MPKRVKPVRKKQSLFEKRPLSAWKRLIANAREVVQSQNIDLNPSLPVQLRTLVWNRALRSPQGEPASALVFEFDKGKKATVSLLDWRGKPHFWTSFVRNKKVMSQAQYSLKGELVAFKVADSHWIPARFFKAVFEQ